jgi:cation-transporting P-type ATPase E
MHWSAEAAGHQSADLMGGRSFCAREIRAWLLSPQSPKRFLVFAALLILGGAWLFFGVLEDVISKDPLVVVDAIVHDLLQGLRTPVMDRLMVGITELGDAEVLVPLILVVLAWLVLRRLWQTALYWLAAIGVVELLVKLLKFALRRPRPGLLYGDIERFSFPSSHATLSVVVYGLLAFLLTGRESGAGQRKAIVLLATSLIVLIAISRLYIGAHWLSDVLAGLSFGAVWVAALAVAYVYQCREEIGAKGLAALVAITLLIAGGAHVATQHASDILRYSPMAGSQR